MLLLGQAKPPKLFHAKNRSRPGRRTVAAIVMGGGALADVAIHRARLQRVGPAPGRYPRNAPGVLDVVAAAMQAPVRLQHGCRTIALASPVGTAAGRYTRSRVHGDTQGSRQTAIAAAPGADAPETVTPRRTENGQSVSVLIQARRKATIAITAMEHPARHGPRKPAVAVCPFHAPRKPRKGEPARHRCRRPPRSARRHLLPKACRVNPSATPIRADKRSK